MGPLFNVPSCVIIGTKNSKTEYPVVGTLFEGTFPKKDIRLVSLEKDRSLLRIKNVVVNLMQIGNTNRFAWSYESIDICQGKMIRKFRSYYYDLFNRGADIYPRPFWFIELKPHEKLGINLDWPYVETSARAKKTAKDEYKDVMLNGNIESKYIFGTLLGSDVLPFCNLPFRLITLPLEPSSMNYRLLDATTLSLKGDLGMSDWMSKVEKEWNDGRKEKSDMYNIYEWLDYRQKLTTQDPRSKFIVLYLTSSTFLASCVIDRSVDLKFCVYDLEMKLSGLLVDTKCYFYQTTDLAEAYYLTSILNSKVLDTLINPFQSRGLWGPRDIHKKPLEFPIPKFDPTNSIHLDLSKLGTNASERARSLLPNLLAELKIDPISINRNAVGRLRSKIRKAIDDNILEIDELVCELFANLEEAFEKSIHIK